MNGVIEGRALAKDEAEYFMPAGVGSIQGMIPGLHTHKQIFQHDESNPNTKSTMVNTDSTLYKPLISGGLT